jgi:acyl carrier protein
MGKKTDKIIINIILKTLKIKKKNIKLNTAIGSIPEWDSLAHLNIFMSISKKFKVDINKASKVKSVKDWINLVK